MLETLKRPMIRLGDNTQTGRNAVDSSCKPCRHWCKFATVPACSSRDQLADTGWNMAGTVADTGWYMLILRLEQADAG